jgi:hypothetical protein
LLGFGVCCVIAIHVAGVASHRIKQIGIPYVVCLILLSRKGVADAGGSLIDEKLDVGTFRAGRW